MYMHFRFQGTRQNSFNAGSYILSMFLQTNSLVIEKRDSAASRHEDVREFRAREFRREEESLGGRDQTWDKRRAGTKLLLHEPSSCREKPVHLSQTLPDINFPLQKQVKEKDEEENGCKDQCNKDKKERQVHLFRAGKISADQQNLVSFKRRVKEESEGRRE